MSQLNLKGLVATIRGTNPYTPIIEAINNAIYSIEKSGRDDGEIVVTLYRNSTHFDFKDTDDAEKTLPEITSIKVTDNGIGFDDDNLRHFDTAYTDNKITVGGKGFGRFVYLKHFSEVKVRSTYKVADNKYNERTFEFGKTDQIVYDPKDNSIVAVDSLTEVNLLNIREGKLDKKLNTVARKILEKILIHFARSDFECPNIVIAEDGGDSVVLNDLLTDEKYAEIKLIERDQIEVLKNEIKYPFEVVIYKIWFPGNQKSRISLVSNYLEVTETPIEEYINEFESGFSGDFKSKTGETSNRYIIKLYVSGKYLDENVSVERASFNFGMISDNLHPVGRRDIESASAELAKTKFKDEVKTRRNDKKEKVSQFVTKSVPYLARYQNKVDVASLKLNPTNDEIELALEHARIKNERNIEAQAKDIVNSDAKKLVAKKTEELIKDITDANKDNLSRYVAHRSAVIDIFAKSLEVNKEGKYKAEGVIHDIIFPLKSDSDSVAIGQQNLWLIDERLNFTEFISSDKAHTDDSKDRSDLFVFHNQIAFRAGDEKQNPVTILEFKKPGRDDFANPSSKENPVKQVVRYVQQIRNGKSKTKGRPINTDENTQFYGYIIVDFTEKVKKWARLDEDFTPMPDGLGYYKWWSNMNLYVEILSWDKIVKDSTLRNRIFTEKLGIS